MSISTRLQTSKMQQQQLQFQRRPSLEMNKQQPQDMNALLLEEIRQMRSDMKRDKEDLRRDMKRDKEDLRQDMDKMKGEIKHEIRSEISDIKKSIKSLTSDIDQVKIKMRAIEIRNQELENELKEEREKRKSLQEERLNWDQKMREKCLKIRGLPEIENENIFESVVNIFAEFLGRDKELMELEIDKVFRVNSWVASQKKVPRDIIIYFSRTYMKEQILQRHFESRLIVDDVELQLLKDIHGDILKKRKEYAFLTKKLREVDIRYRWESPEGISFRYKHKRQKITSVLQARDFLEDLMKDIELQQEADAQDSNSRNFVSQEKGRPKENNKEELPEERKAPSEDSNSLEED